MLLCFGLWLWWPRMVATDPWMVPIMTKVSAHRSRGKEGRQREIEREEEKDRTTEREKCSKTDKQSVTEVLTKAVRY